MSQQFLADWTWMSLFGWVWENNISKNLIEIRQIIILMYISFASNLKNTFRAKLCHSHTIWMMIYILSKNPKSSEWFFELLCCILVAEHSGISHWISTFVRVTDSPFFFCRCRRLHFKDNKRVETSLFETLLVHNSVEIPTKIVGFERNELLNWMQRISK